MTEIKLNFLVIPIFQLIYSSVVCTIPRDAGTNKLIIFVVFLVWLCFMVYKPLWGI